MEKREREKKKTKKEIYVIRVVIHVTQENCVVLDATLSFAIKELKSSLMTY